MKRKKQKGFLGLLGFETKELKSVGKTTTGGLKKSAKLIGLGAKGKLVVHRKGYRKRSGTYIKPKTFKIPDRGAVGRGRKVIPKLKKGTLGIHFKMSDAQIKTILKQKARTMGEKTVVSKLVALEVMNKRTNPTVSRKAKALAHWVAGEFKGRRDVGFPKGLRKR